MKWHVKPIVIALVAGLVLVLTAFAWINGGKRPAVYQGWVEADLLFIGPDEPGRLIELNVREGEVVKEGAPLFVVQHDIQDAELRQAKSAVEEAKARLARAEAAQQRPEEVAVLEAQEVRVRAALAASEADFKRAQVLVEKGIAAPQRLDQAKAAYERDNAQLLEVRRQIQVARMGARTEDVAAARDVLAQSEARLAAAETRRRQRAVSAPVAGLLQEIFFRPGEVVAAGRPIIALLPPGNVKARFFVPQQDLPKVSHGQQVRIACDGCPDGLTARISFIAAQAEFTPPVIYSREERAKLVFRVEALPDQPERLRVGQPITVQPLTLAAREIANETR
jgi:HlyD family secretion protein